MTYTRPEIVSKVTKLDKPFFDNLLDGVDEKLSVEEANGTYAPVSVVPQVDTAYSVATRGFPKFKRPAAKMLGFFGAAGHGYTGNAVGGGSVINVADTSQPMLGAQSVSIQFPTTATAGGQISNTAIPAFSIRNKYVRLTFRWTGSISSISIYLASDTAFANRMQCQVLFKADNPADQDWTVDIPVSEFTAAGTPDLDNIIAARIQVGAAYGTVGQAWFGQLALTADANTQLPNGALIISLDDSKIDHWTIARPKLAQYGFPATVYPILEHIVPPSYTASLYYSLEQARYMQDVHGWDIGYHASTQAAHNTGMGVGVSEATIRSEMESIIALNRQYDFRGDSFAYPSTEWSTTAMRVLGNYARSARAGSASGITETHPANNPMALKAKNAAGFTLAQAKAYLDRAKAGRSVAHLFYHSLPETKVGSNDVARQDFLDLVDYAATIGIPVYTVSQVMNMPLA